MICLDKLSTDVKVPSNWVKINSTKKTIRYHPPEVLAALDKLSLAKEELGVVSLAAWNSFLRDFGKHYVEFQACVQALAALDCLHSFSTKSRAGIKQWLTNTSVSRLSTPLWSSKSHTAGDSRCTVASGSAAGKPVVVAMFKSNV